MKLKGDSMLKKIIRAAALSSAMILAVGTANAQKGEYPNRTIEMIMPYQAGGATETFARLILDDMAEILGQSIVMLHRPGAAGTIGARNGAEAKPDGYTLLANTSGHVMYEGLFKDLPFDPVDDFSAVGVFGFAPIILVTSAKSDITSFEELVKQAENKTITFASGAQGSLPHLTGERVARLGDLDMMHIAFSGNAPALTNVMGGHVDTFYSTAASVIPQIKSGDLRALAVSTKERMPELPDVPTVAELLDAPEFDVTAWYALWAPKGTPEEIVEQLNGAMRQASETPRALKRLAEYSVQPSNLTAREFDEFARQERKVWLEVMEQVGLEQ